MTPSKSARSLECATCSKAQFSAIRTACASMRNSSTAETGAHLSADRFQEDVADLFKLQDDVVARLANGLGDELVKAEARGDRRIATYAFDSHHARTCVEF